ncbi:MAG: hypothetical protein V1662_05125, partial [Candidatus Omnitrophota bacterium]
MAMKLNLYTKKPFFKLVSIGLILLFAVNVFNYDAAEGLSPWCGLQSGPVRRDIQAGLWKESFIYATDAKQKQILSQNHTDVVPYSGGKFLVSEDLKNDNLKLLRSVIREQTSVIMRIMAEKEPDRYKTIREAVLSRQDVVHAYSNILPGDKKPIFMSDPLLLNDILSRAFEILVLLRGQMICPRELTVEEIYFINTINSVISGNCDTLFTGIFWDWYCRQIEIRVACANGQKFYQDADAGQSVTEFPCEYKIAPGKLSVNVKFKLKSPFSSRKFIDDRARECECDLDPAPKPGENYDIRDETFSVYIPKNYDRKNPPGVIVWIPGDSDYGFPPREWLKLMKKYNLIWVGANKSGNKWSLYKRFGLALDAIHNISQTVKINENNVYMTGFSGGGRCSSMISSLLSAFPMEDGSVKKIFSGGLFMCGVNDPFKGRTEISDLIKTQNRFVFLTGDNDINLEDTQENMMEWIDFIFSDHPDLEARVKTAEEWLAAGKKRFKIKNVTYIQVPDMRHNGIFKPENIGYYEYALQSLLTVPGRKPLPQAPVPYEADTSPARDTKNKPDDKGSMKFDRTDGRLKGGYQGTLAIKIGDIGKNALRLKRSGESLILYADDILRNTAVLDMAPSIKRMFREYNILKGGKVIIFAGDKDNAAILNKLLSGEKQGIEIITITREELGYPKNTNKGDADQAKDIIRYARARGAKDILALIKGP